MQVKRIERHPKYIVSTEGSVYRERKDGFHELEIDFSNGYGRVDLDGKKESVARLVMEAFNPSEDPSMRVSYKNGDPTNCSLSNLVWLTQSQAQIYSKYTPEYRSLIFAGRS